MKKLLALLLLINTGCATSMERCIKQTQPKVVKIGIVLDGGETGSGSGGFIDNKGTVLTCAHVVNKSKITKIYVKLADGSFYPGVVVKIDVLHDLALIATMAQKTPYFSLGYTPRLGQQVIALGSPLGIQHSVGIGWVENILKKKLTYVIHSAFILPGSSGGPLIDLKGRLIGVNEAVIMLNPFVPAAGFCVAIDVEEVRNFLRRDK